ncbi:MAG: transporter substrate-binding protein [Enterovirga sp.]|jgi:putative spermidine/putrescine transport system substrate-binding protein|nr:transporter substrate-binding protein [Enterovirga sp.]
MSGISRRWVLGAGLGAPLVARFGIASANAQAPGGLRVATWGGSWRDSIEQNVASKVSGLKVEYTLGNPDDNLAKLIAAKRQSQVPFDVMEGFPQLTPPMSKGGLITKIDYDAMPQAKALPAWARGEYQIIGLSTQDGIVYNAEKFKEAGIEPPKRYGDLANPKLKGRLAFPDIGNAQHWNAVVGLAYENGGDEANMEPAAKAVAEIAPGYFFSASTELATRFGSGDVWAAPWHSGWAVRLRRSNVPVSVAYTTFGERTGALWPVPQYIVAGTPNLKGAQGFLDEMMSPAGQFDHGKATGSVPSNAAARAKLAEDALSRELLFLDDERVNRAFQIDWAKLDDKKWRETWTRQVRR